MAQRVCPECGHVESEYTFFCTKCGAKTIESAALEPAKVKPITGTSASQEGIRRQSSLVNEQSDIKAYHDQNVQDQPRQSSGPEVCQQDEQADQEETPRSTDKAFIPPIPSTYKGTSIVGIIVGAIVLIVLIVSLVSKKPWATKNDNDIGSNPVETEQAVVSNNADNNVYEDQIEHESLDEAETEEVAKVSEKDESSVLSEEQDNTIPADVDAIYDIDPESEVVSIREKYNEIVGIIQGDGCREVDISKEVTGYISDGVNAIYVKKGYDNYEYSRKYYFDNGKLIFAYFESYDAHRLYFKNDRLFRWRYSQNAADSQNAVNHDLDNADGYDTLETFAINEAYMLLVKLSEMNIDGQ